MSRRRSSRTVRNLSNNVVNLLTDYPRSLSAAGIVSTLIGNVTGIRNKTLSPGSIGKLMMHLIGHNGIIRRRNGKFGYEYLYSPEMELMQNTIDFVGELEWLI